MLMSRGIQKYDTLLACISIFKMKALLLFTCYYNLKLYLVSTFSYVSKGSIDSDFLDCTKVYVSVSETF